MLSRKTLNEISPRAQTLSCAKQPYQLTQSILLTLARLTSTSRKQLVQYYTI